METIDLIKHHLLKEHPQLYWRWKREEHEKEHGPHYNEEFAKWDVEHMHHSENNVTMRGEMVTMHEAKEMRMMFNIPSSVTDCDLYVAVNATYHDKVKLMKSWFGKEDWKKHLMEEAYTTYFADEDGGDGIIWRWMNCLLNN